MSTHSLPLFKVHHTLSMTRIFKTFSPYSFYRLRLSLTDTQGERTTVDAVINVTKPLTAFTRSVIILQFYAKVSNFPYPIGTYMRFNRCGRLFRCRFFLGMYIFFRNHPEITQLDAFQKETCPSKKEDPKI